MFRFLFFLVYRFLAFGVLFLDSSTFVRQDSIEGASQPKNQEPKKQTHENLKTKNLKTKNLQT